MYRKNHFLCIAERIARFINFFSVNKRLYAPVCYTFVIRCIANCYTLLYVLLYAQNLNQSLTQPFRAIQLYITLGRPCVCLWAFSKLNRAATKNLYMLVKKFIKNLFIKFE